MATLAWACAPAPQTVQAAGRKHILLVTVEGLRFDAVGAYAPWWANLALAKGSETEPTGPEPTGLEPWEPQTPNMDRLAANALLYGYALSPSSWCAPALAGLLTSEYPTDLGFTDLSKPLTAEAITLAEVLKSAGWDTKAFVEHPFLGQRQNLDQGFASYEQGNGESDRKRSEAVLGQALTAIDDIGSRSTFLWVQLGGLGPPFESQVASGDGQQPLSRADWMRYREQWSPEDLAQLRRMYAEEVQRMDQHVGALLDRLDQEGLAHDTLVVLTSSNGCELLEQGLIGDATGLQAPLIRVPLMISIAGKHSGAIEDPVSLLDVAPSLLRLVGLSAPTRWQGVSVLPADPLPQRKIFSELSRAGQQFAMVGERYKLVWEPAKERVQLFDIFEDPMETRDVATQQPAIVQEGLQALQRFHPQTDIDPGK